MRWVTSNCRSERTVIYLHLLVAGEWFVADHLQTKRISGYLPLQTQFEITILCRAHRVFLFIFCLYYVSVEYCTNTAFIYVTAYTPKNKRLEKQTCKVHTLSWSSKIAQKWSAELVWHRPTYRLDITAVVGKMRYCGIWNAEGKMRSNSVTDRQPVVNNNNTGLWIV